jgi:type IV pilus assembly protein PilW
MKTPITLQRSRLPSKQRGYTLIEILVALLISLFLLFGLFTLESGTRQTNANQTALTQLQDEERLAMSLLNDVVQEAGYFPNATANANNFISFPVTATFANSGANAAQMISGTDGATDTLAVQFMSNLNDSIITCAGTTNTAGNGTIYSNVFSVSVSNQLQCSLNGAAPVPLVSGVTNFQVLYGLATASPSTSNDVDTYMTATQVSATPANWLNVTSVRVIITFINPLCAPPTPCQPGQPTTVNFGRTIDLMARTGVRT